ncbi:MAG: hypothetical protein AB7E55_23110 [Pigmentiphaga sp.]
MKFFPPADQPVQIALTTGHIAIVEPTGTELHPNFHREAIAKGCMPEGVERETPETGKAFDKMSSIVEAMQMMAEEPNEADFTADGKPKTDAVSKIVGFTVSREERDNAWEAVADDGGAE